MSLDGSRPVTRDDLDRLVTPEDLGAALRAAREHAGIQLRELEQIAARRRSGLKPPGGLVGANLNRTLISDMENGRRIMVSDKSGTKKDDRLEFYLALCGINHDSRIPWLDAAWRICSPSTGHLLPQRATDATLTRRPNEPYLGRPISTLTDFDALVLEVHPSIAITDAQQLPLLPPYLQRSHDDRLRAELRMAACGQGRVVTLVGGSSTGKTRACWEAMRAILPTWRVWHPLSPERPEAIINAIRAGRVGPRTVIWLNEAQMYLQRNGIGARVASELQALLTPDLPTPVVIMGSMWPEHFRQLTADRSDANAAARQLLRGSDIAVPSEFSDSELRDSATQIASDPRLQLAAQHGSRLTQYLAGVPERLRRFEHADEYERAVLYTALDVARLSRWRAMPAEFFRQAAPGYLAEDTWNLTDDWAHHVDSAIASLIASCNGTPGPLHRVKHKSGATPDQQVYTFYLDDYILQHRRASRNSHFPPASFWEAAQLICTEPSSLTEMARAAREMGRLRRAHQLNSRAADLGDSHAMCELAARLADAGELTSAEQLWQQAAEHGNGTAFYQLVRQREMAGDRQEAERIALQATGHGHPSALSMIMESREATGDREAAERIALQAAGRGDIALLSTLARRRDQRTSWSLNQLLTVGTPLAAKQADLSLPPPLLELTQNDRRDPNESERLWRKAVELGEITGTTPLVQLAGLRKEAGDLDEAERLWQQAADHGEARALLQLALLRDQAGDRAAADAIALKAADSGHEAALSWLVKYRIMIGDYAAAERAARYAAARGEPWPLRDLAVELEPMNPAEAERLARLVAKDGHPIALHQLARARKEAGNLEGALTLWEEAASLGVIESLRELACLRADAGDPDGAKRYWCRAADLGDFGAFCELATLSKRAGDIREAEKCWQRIIELSSHGLSATAFVLDSIGYHDGAEWIRRASGPRGDIETLSEQVRRHEQAGEHNQADHVAFSAADRGQLEVLRVLAQCRAEANDRDGAERLWIAVADRSNGAALWMKIEDLRAAGDTEAADDLFECRDRGMSALYELAELRERAGDTDGAAQLRKYGIDDDGSPAKPWD